MILSYDGHDIAKLRDLPLAVAETPVGEKAPVKVWRDGHETTLDADDRRHAGQSRADGAPATSTRARRPKPQTATAMGLKLAPLTADLRRELHVPQGRQGRGGDRRRRQSSPLAELGLAPGDVIQPINQEPVTHAQGRDAPSSTRSARTAARTCCSSSTATASTSTSRCRWAGDNG